MDMKKQLVFLMLFFHLSNSIVQELTPEQYFGDSYYEAASYCTKRQSAYAPFFSGYKVSFEEAMAVVFPEIIRYNRFRDFAETTVLELAYVQGGKTIADFSIGRFQMKPSFVEFIEQDLLNYSDLLQQFNEVVAYSPDVSSQDIRCERIERLKQESWQLKYLACFIRLAEVRFAKKLNEKPQERLLILSSAYNKGLNSKYEELKRLSEKKSFPYGTTAMGRFSYYDVANYFFTHNAPENQNYNR